MNPLLQQLFDRIDALPQTSFNQVRTLRAAAGDDQMAQNELAREDRRSYARDYINENGPGKALGLAVSIPAEQILKYFELGPSKGRSEFDPAGQIKAGYQGIIQGLDDAGMFGRGLKQ